MSQLGGTALHLAQGELQLGRGETLRDTAMVLSRYLDAVMIRTFSQADIDELATWADIPVDQRPLGRAPSLPGAGRSADAARAFRARSAGRAPGLRRRCQQRLPLARVRRRDRGRRCRGRRARRLPARRADRALRGVRARGQRGSLTLTEDADEAARGAQALATDAFISMGQEVETAERLDALMPGYRVDERRVGAARRRRHRAALPARPLRAGDRRIGALRAPFGRLGSGREPAACPEGAAGRDCSRPGSRA